MKTAFFAFFTSSILWIFASNASALAAAPEVEIFPTGHPDAIYYRVWETNNQEEIAVFNGDGEAITGEIRLADNGSNGIKVFVPEQPLALGDYDVTITHPWINPHSVVVTIVARPETYEFGSDMSLTRNLVYTETICCDQECEDLYEELPMVEVTVWTNTALNFEVRAVVDGEIHANRTQTVVGESTFSVGSATVMFEEMCVVIVAIDLDGNLVGSSEECLAEEAFPTPTNDFDVDDEVRECHEDEQRDKIGEIMPDGPNDPNDPGATGEKSRATCSSTPSGNSPWMLVLALVGAMSLRRRR